jgi:hypothetical protein
MKRLGVARQIGTRLLDLLIQTRHIKPQQLEFIRAPQGL